MGMVHQVHYTTHLLIMNCRLYYFFYENMRNVILNSRLGSKALSTRESMLAGMVAGECFFIVISPQKWYI